MKNYLSLALLSVMILLSAGSCRNETDKRPAVSQSFRFEEYTIDQLQQGYRNGDFTITQVVQAYLDRIAAVDDSGPMLNAVIQINPDALTIAAELDRELKEGKSRGPMH
ncbi:MAG TPA: hypothetical protein VFB86_06940, partial [Bacteroidales bacterium]|nr:hypothetical protein [Bacteroidales bacterium]